MQKSKGQYSKVAATAVELIRNGEHDFYQAWAAAALKHISSEESRIKGCPKSAFIGLCDHGHIRHITGSGKYTSKNLNYTIVAIKLWRENPMLKKHEIWKMVQSETGSTARHQGQLDVILGVWEFLH